MIATIPADFAVIVPSDETVATDVSLDDQLTSLFVASDGETVAISCDESPSTKERVRLESFIPETGMAFTVTWHVAVLP